MSHDFIENAIALAILAAVVLALGVYAQRCDDREARQLADEDRELRDLIGSENRARIRAARRWRTK